MRLLCNALQESEAEDRGRGGNSKYLNESSLKFLPV